MADVTAVDAALGSRVRQRRQQRALSRAELAAMLGIPEFALEEIEAGRRRAGGALAVELATALDVSLAFLFGADQERS